MVKDRVCVCVCVCAPAGCGFGEEGSQSHTPVDVSGNGTRKLVSLKSKHDARSIKG